MRTLAELKGNSATSYRKITQKLYNNRVWRNLRRWYLASHPVCVMCEKEGKQVAATVVDHVVPHGGNETLFWSVDNLQPLCVHHHNKKTHDEQIH